MSDAREAEKRAAAEAAAELVQDGMAVGLGTGSTASWMIEALGRRVQAGLTIVAIPTSEHSAAQARKVGIRLITFAERLRLDLTIDGADEIAQGSLNLIKGLGGALLREKIVAAASDRLVIVGDHSKLVDKLGATPVPIEVVEFGWQTTRARIEALGGQPALRMASDGTPFRSDGGNLILDCAFGRMDNPAELETRLKGTLGVIATGLFIGMAEMAYVAGPDGVRVLSSGA
jgi:ribose 5-phosphate isomerase A